jgi:hypothetical protein
MPECFCTLIPGISKGHRAPSSLDLRHLAHKFHLFNPCDFLSQGFLFDLIIVKQGLTDYHRGINLLTMEFS